MERVRVLGVSPETDEVGIRSVLGVYGEILETRKGFISKKLPGCTNGIWTVKLIMDKDKCLPPFLIMKEEGEVWQLATGGEASVCWKCGQPGHIGDKCHQDVSALAASLSSSAESHQPSWAHVVRGARGVVLQHPRPPPVSPCLPKTGVLGNPITGETLRVSRDKLSFSREPVDPPVRDENGKVILFGRVLRDVEKEVDKAVDKAMSRVEVLPPPAVVVLDVEVERMVEVAVLSVLEVTVDKFVMENVGMFVANFLDRLDKNIDEAVDRVLKETVDRSVLEAVHEAFDQAAAPTADEATDQTVILPAAVDSVEGQVGLESMDEAVNEDSSMTVSDNGAGDEAASPGVAKLLKAESGSAVPASEICSFSPPRVRKVAISNSEQSSEIKSGGNFIKFKNVTIAFPKGTEYEDGRILFCYDKSCRHEQKNMSENIEDYFVKLEDCPSKYMRARFVPNSNH